MWLGSIGVFADPEHIFLVFKINFKNKIWWNNDTIQLRRKYTQNVVDWCRSGFNYYTQASFFPLPISMRRPGTQCYARWKDKLIHHDIKNKFPIISTLSPFSFLYLIIWILTLSRKIYSFFKQKSRLSVGLPA